jgi:hypothetical protein
MDEEASMPQHLPPVEYLHKILRLDPETGALHWRERTPDMFSEDCPGGPHGACERWNALYANKPAFTTISGGNLVGAIHGVSVGAHRVVFALYHNRWSGYQLQHIDGDTMDNRPCNLRETDRPVSKPVPDADTKVWFTRPRRTSGRKKAKNWVLEMTESLAKR